LIKAIIFDFGGVYFTYSKELRLKALRKKLGIEEEIIEKAWSKYIDDYNKGRISEGEFWKRFKRDLGLRITNQELRRTILSIFRPIKPVHKLVKELRKNFKVGLLTDQSKWLDILDKKYKIYKNFDRVVVSYKVGAIKPNKKIYRIALKKLGVRPEEIVFIDDDKENVEGARRVGMKAILFKNSTQLRKELEKLGLV